MAFFSEIAQGLGAVTAPKGKSARLTVLLYHRVLAQHDPLMPLVPDAAGFDAQISALSQVFRILDLEESLGRLRAGTLPPRSLCITFDDGYRDNLEVAAPILKRYGASATFFIATGFIDGGRMVHDTIVETVRRLPMQDIDLTWIGLGTTPLSDVNSRIALIDRFVSKVKYLDFGVRQAACERLTSYVDESLPTDLMMTSDQLRQLAGSGMSIGAHTHDHPILAKITNEEALAQIVQSRETLADMMNVVPMLFAYPNGKPNLDYRARHVGLVKLAGFIGAVSVSAGTASRESDHFQVPRFVPWDSNPRNLILRILAQPWRHRETPLAAE